MSKKRKVEGMFCVNCQFSQLVPDEPTQCKHRNAENDKNKSCASQRLDALKCGPTGLFYAQKED
jgi:hypothetical protein